MLRLRNTATLAILLSSGIPPVFAQAPSSFFQIFSRPTNPTTCDTKDCWLEATQTCTPKQFSTDVSIGIAAADSIFELWGTTATGACVSYQLIQSLAAFGQGVPDGSGMEIICLYPQPRNLTFEWEVFLGQRAGTFGGTGGIVDPQTGISVSSKTINDREVAQCAIRMPNIPQS